MTNFKFKRKPETQVFQSQVIKHRFFKEAFQIIEQVHSSYEPLSSSPGLVTKLVRGAEPEGAVILGVPGSGKSTLLANYLQKTYVEGSDEADRTRVLYVEIEHRATTKKVITEMLRLLGSKKWDKGTEQTKFIELKTLLWEQQVELILFDEINNLIPKHAGRSTIDVCDFFKSLMNQTKIPLILSGTLDAEEVILNNNELADRLNALHYMQNFCLASKPNQKDHFMDYMACIEKAIPVDTVSLTEPDMLKRFFLASLGNPRKISRMVSATMDYANLSKPLVMEDYDKGYKKSLRSKALRPSPFDSLNTGKDLLVIHANREGKK